MSQQRIASLQQMLQETPNDPFLLYALALEHRNNDRQQSLLLFRRLLQLHAHYLPTYYHAAALHAELGELQEAKSIYQQGIAIAQDQQDAHTLRELQNAYQNLLLDLDEL
ncbi:MAG: tetratricopeptide repeat protein [Bacteroidetes bacterium]|nr:tetratricopeptide repeat protein [Bacteroidota bacterium]